MLTAPPGIGKVWWSQFRCQLVQMVRRWNSREIPFGAQNERIGDAAFTNYFATRMMPDYALAETGSIAAL
jgi:hypothetical protein